MGLDHLVLTVADLDATLRFYRDGLGMTVSDFGVDGMRLDPLMEICGIRVLRPGGTTTTDD